MYEDEDWAWDESEYSFFMSLHDEDKLEYMFDFFNHDNTDITDDDFDFDFESETPHTQRVDVEVLITYSHFTITCSKSDVLDRTILMFMMDGYILIHQQTKGNTRIYKYVGTTLPRSVN